MAGLIRTNGSQASLVSQTIHDVKRFAQASNLDLSTVL
jgi:hypothetical protein